MHLSIVIPALNEAGSIVATLARLQRMRDKGSEVILVDGGSRDATKALARALVDHVIDSRPGRAIQMNQGAAAATGEALLFLHADSLLPEGADQLIFECLTGTAWRWGRFDVTIRGGHFMFPIIAWFMNHRSRLTGIATGDQGIFMVRAAFEQAGGFPDQTLMEDIEICKRLRRIGCCACLSSRVITSGRRWERHGVWRTIALMWRLRFLYWIGVPAHRLARSYR